MKRIPHSAHLGKKQKSRPIKMKLQKKPDQK